MTAADVQIGLAAAVKAHVAGITAYATLPDALGAAIPAFGCVEVEINYDQVFAHGLDMGLFSCGVYTSRGDTQTGRDKLADFTARSGATSIKAAIETDKTLGSRAKTLHVERVRGAYRLYTIGGIDYLGAVFETRVWF